MPFPLGLPHFYRVPHDVALVDIFHAFAESTHELSVAKEYYRTIIAPKLARTILGVKLLLLFARLPL